MHCQEQDQIDGKVDPFLKPADPNFGETKGNVRWLNDVQRSMMQSLQDIMAPAYKAYPATARKQWSSSGRRR